MKYYIFSRKKMYSFFLSRKASIATVFCISLITMITVIAAAIDHSLLIRKYHVLQNAADSMSLAANKGLIISEKKAEIAAYKYFLANLHAFQSLNEIKYSVDVLQKGGTREIKVTLSGVPELHFDKIMRWSSKRISVTSISKDTDPIIEIALVLDISGSMEEKGKIDAMKEAAQIFIDSIFSSSSAPRRVRVSLVPFGTSVRFNKQYYREWLAFNENYDQWTGCLIPTEPYEEYASNDIRFARNRKAIISRIANIPVKGQAYEAHTITCPLQESEVLEFSNEPRDLKKAIDNLNVGHGTGTDIAIAWGYRLLSPSWRGKFYGDPLYPLDFSNNHFKYIVLMTDGEIWGQIYQAFGNKYHWGARMIAEKNFEYGCNNVKNDGIQIFTIGFDISNSRFKSTQEQLLKCASHKDNYFLAEIDNIASVFENIAKKITTVMIAQ